MRIKENKENKTKIMKGQVTKQVSVKRADFKPFCV